MATFTSRLANFSFSMRIDGVKRYFSFTHKGQPFTEGILTILDDKIAKALHQHPDYGTIFKQTDEPAPAEGRSEPIETANIKHFYTNVTKSQEAKEILVREHNVEPDELKTKEAIKKKAEILNISFPNLK